jgi:hypothetical protein
MPKRAKCAGRRAKAVRSLRRRGGSVVELAWQGLVEEKLRDRFAEGWIEGGGLVEEEVSLGRSASGENGWLQVGQFEVEEDRGDDGWVCEKRENPHLATTSRAEQWEYFVDACEEDGPTDASCVRRPGGLDGFFGGRQCWRALDVAVGCVRLGSADGHDGWAKSGVWGKHAVIPIPVNARWWHKSSEAFEKLKRREQDLGAAVLGWLRKAVQEASVRGVQGRGAVGRMEPLQREGRPGTVPITLRCQHALSWYACGRAVGRTAGGGAP